MDDDSRKRVNFNRQTASLPSRWLRQLFGFFRPKVEDRDDLLIQLRAAFKQNLMDAEALAMIEGVLSFSNMSVSDVMIPRSQMGMVRVSDSMEKTLGVLIDAAHSRFPVMGDDKDDVIGILLAKDVLRYVQNPQSFHLKDTLRPAIFVPESKPLNVLLRDFKKTRNHMAIVVDEYGSVAGLVTIEDVIEQIVGDIEDEHDFDETEDYIVAMAGGRFRIKAITDVSDFNEYFDAELSDEHADTIGGLVLHALGHLPVRGECIQIGAFEFTVLRADSRRLHTLVMTQCNPTQEE
jgi:magnesium and cobalt transporter